MDEVLGRTCQGRERVKLGNGEAEREAKPGTGELAVRAVPRTRHILHERHFLNKNNRREHERPQQMPAVTVSLCAGLVYPARDMLCSSLKYMALH